MCVSVCVSQASAGHISAVRESAGREHSYFCLKYIHHTRAEAKPVSPQSPCAPSQNDLSCVSVCLSLLVYLCERERERECVYECIMSDLWRRPRPGQKGQKWRETVRHYAPPRVSFCYLLLLPRRHTEGFSLTLPSSSPCSQLDQAAIQEYWDKAPHC